MIGDQRVALVVPTLNEAEAIGPALARVPRHLVDRVIVADGGSRDATVAEARRAGAEVVNAGRGYGRACMEGALAAGDSPIVVFMDGDGADRPEVVANLVEPIAAGSHDFVIGSRTRGQRKRGSMGLHQVLAGHVVGRLIGSLYGVAYTDMCAFRAIRRDALLGLGMAEVTFGWNIEMQMKAARAGLRILEVPVPYGARVAGKSKVAGSLRGSIHAGVLIVSTVVRVARAPMPARTGA